MEDQLKPIAILGAGSWGTAIALYLARRQQTVKLWSIEPAEIAAMLRDKANNHYLPGIKLEASIYPTVNLAETLEAVEDVIMVVPSVGFRQTLTMLKATGNKKYRIICATKGLDAKTGQLLSEVATEVLGKDHAFAVLSGPSFAREVAAGLPAAVVIASYDKFFLADLVKRFDSPLFRISPSHDVIGVEAGGVVKNVIAVAIGIADGKELGANTRSALITQGLAEMRALGTALGGHAETFIGLAGLGDLILTCSDNQSRNRRFGLAIGKGQDVKAALDEIGQVVEGKNNTELIAKLAAEYNIEMPICQAVYRILQNETSVEQAFSEIFSKSFK